MESRLQSNEVRIPKRVTSSATSSPLHSSSITSNGCGGGVNNSAGANTLTTSSNNHNGTSYLAINFTTSSSSNNSPTHMNNSNMKKLSNGTCKNMENLNIKLNGNNNNNNNNNNNKGTATTITMMKDAASSPPPPPLPSIAPPSILNNSITTKTTQALPDFDLDAPCQYFKSSFARSLSLAGSAGINGYNNGNHQTKSLDFSVNFGLSRNSPISEEILTTNGYEPAVSSSGLIFSTFHENLHYNTLIQQQQQRNKSMSNKIMSLTTTTSINDSNGGHEICNNGGNSNNNSPNRKMKFLNGNNSNSNNNNNNNNNNNGNTNNSNGNSNVWSTSETSPPSASSNSSASSLRKQNLNRRSLDSSEIELLRLRKECQNLVEENRRLMGLASGMVRGNLIIPGNSSNIEAVILQTQVDTLQWQLKQVEASREMYRAVMEEVVRFLERCHRNMENLQNQNNNQQQGATNMRPRSIHQMQYRHNDISSLIESDTSSILSGTLTAQPSPPPHQQQIQSSLVTAQLISTSTSTPISTTSHSSVLNQSSLSAMFSNQNMSPRARTSTNIIDANNSPVITTGAKVNGSIDDDVSNNSSNNSLVGDCTSSAIHNNNNNNNITTTSAAISSNNYKDFTWRRSPKRQQNSQWSATASRDIEKLSQEAFRLLRTAQNLLHTQEPDLTQSKVINPDLSLISTCSNHSSLPNHHQHLLPSVPSVIIPSTGTKSNSTTNLDTDPFLITSFARKLNMRESRLSLRSSTDSSVHSTTSSSSNKTTETDEENNTTLHATTTSAATTILQQLQQQNNSNKLQHSSSTSSNQSVQSVNHQQDQNKESPVCSSTISSSTTEDESGFSSISSFQEIGLPLHSTMISNSVNLLNNTSSSLSSSNSDDTTNNSIMGGGNKENTVIDNNISRNSTLKSMHHNHHHQHSLVNGIGLPSSTTTSTANVMHRRWDSAPAVPPRNSLHRFTSMNGNGDEGPTVLWV